MPDDLGHYMEAVSRYREALRTIAGSDPNGMEGFHFVGDEDKPEECPGCVARAALDAQRQSMQSDGGRMTITLTQLVFTRVAPELLPEEAEPIFVPFAEAPETPREHRLVLDREVWADMGEPTQVTVTIEPGDTLNGSQR